MLTGEWEPDCWRKQAITPTKHRLGSNVLNGYGDKSLKAGLDFDWSALEDDFRTFLFSGPIEPALVSIQALRVP